MTTLALVIPCKNEYRRVNPTIFLEAVKIYPYLTFLFVDDGSTDRTAETLAFLSNQSPAIHALYLPKNVGKAEAVRTGIQWLLSNSHAEVLGFWDADLATPLGEIPAFISALEKSPSNEVVLGARWPHLGAEIKRSLFRNLTGALMKHLISRALGTSVYDTQCGAKIFRRELAAEIFSRPFFSRWLFDVELLKRIGPRRLHHAVVEHPLESWRDVPGSKVRLTDSLRVFYDLFVIAHSNNYPIKKNQRASDMKQFTLAILPFVLICVVCTVALDHFASEQPPASSQEAFVRAGFMPTVYTLTDVHNSRDCGGWTTLDGRRVRTGRLIRSGELNHIDKKKRVQKDFQISRESQIFFTSNLNVRTDIDLRSPEECVGMTASPLGTNVTWVHIPSKAYFKVGSPEGREGFAQVFRTLLDEQSYPAVIHCRAGRDRAGTAVYLLNALLGVPEKNLIRDWEMTERLKGNSRFDHGRIGGIDGVLCHYPGSNVNARVEGFVHDLGFTIADINRFRSLMLESK